MKYRAEIDGLRAFAVLPVILFHAGVSAFSGGYVGVDIFFVISGYLITTILIDDLEAKRFSLVHFYERRARRILPALFLVMLVCVPVAWAILLPNEFKEFCQSLAAVSLFGLNILFYKQSNYFDIAAELKPLLHTWSLAVEEQYYIFFPLILWLGWRLGKRNIILLLGVLAVASLCVAELWLVHKPIKAFYLLPARGWEILAGAFAAFYLRSKSRLSLNFENVLSGIGFLGILVSIFLFDERTAFPGINAVIPVVATTLLILFAHPGTWVQKFLSQKLFVGVGLISYSAYLWHQPLFAFARNAISLKPSLSLMLALSAISIVLAYLTWRFVENPFRDKNRIQRKTVFQFSGIGILFFVALGLGGHFAQGFPNRFNIVPLYDGDVGHLEFHKYVAEKYERCTPEQIAAKALTWEGFLRCMQSKPGGNVQVALVGDSHAEHLFIGIAEEWPEKNVAFYILNAPPFLSVPNFHDIFEHVISTSSVETVILTMQWVARRKEVPRDSNLEAELSAALERLIGAGKSVVVLDDVPQFNSKPEHCKYGVEGAAITNVACLLHRSEVDVYEKRYIETLRRVAAKYPQVKLLHLVDYFCDLEFCSMVQENTLMFRDNNHLNIPGSKYVGRKLKEVLEIR